MKFHENSEKGGIAAFANLINSSGLDGQGGSEPSLVTLHLIYGQRLSLSKIHCLTVVSVTCMDMFKVIYRGIIA